MIPRQPMKGETGLSDSEAAYLSDTLYRDPQSIDYGKTPSNPVSRVLQRTEREWAISNIQPEVQPLRSQILATSTTAGNTTFRGFATMGQRPFRLGQVWLRGEGNSQVAGSEILGLECVAGAEKSE